MKRPVVLIKTEAEARTAIDWLYANGWSIGPFGSRETALSMLIDRLSGEGCELFTSGSPKYFDMVRYPHTSRYNNIFTSVNSFAHFKHYLKRHNL